jgi:hypothetical protein
MLISIYSLGLTISFFSLYMSCMLNIFSRDTRPVGILLSFNYSFDPSSIQSISFSTNSCKLFMNLKIYASSSKTFQLMKLSGIEGLKIISNFPFSIKSSQGWSVEVETTSALTFSLTFYSLLLKTKHQTIPWHPILHSCTFSTFHFYMQTTFYLQNY